MRASGFLGRGEEAGVEVAAGPGLAPHRPTCDPLCLRLLEGLGTSAEGVAVLGRATGTGFSCTVGPFELLDGFVSHYLFYILLNSVC